MDIDKMMIDFSEYLKGESVQNESDAEKYLLKFMEERNIDPAEVLSSAVDSDEFGKSYEFYKKGAGKGHCNSIL